MNEKRLNGRIGIMSISGICVVLSLLNTFFLFIQNEYSRYGIIVFRFPSMADLILHIFYLGVSIALLCYASGYNTRRNPGGSVAVAYGMLAIFPTMTIVMMFALLIQMNEGGGGEYFNISVSSESGIMLLVLLLIVCFVAVVTSVSSVFTVVTRSSKAVPIISIIFNLVLYIWSLASCGKSIGELFEMEMGIQALKILFVDLIPLLLIICLLIVTACNKKEDIAG